MSVVIQKAKELVPEIQFSEAAEKHIIAYLLKTPEQKGIRLSVKKSGCSGFSYVVEFVKESLDEDLTLALQGQYLVCVDKRSYPYLKNMQVDYVQQGLNFKFVFNNPNQKGACGCGESFTVE